MTIPKVGHQTISPHVARLTATRPTMILVTDDREQTAEMALAALDQGFPPNIEVDVRLTVDEILESPYLAIGSYEEIAEQIRNVRAKTGMSYVGVFPTQMEAFAPVIPLLAGE